MNATVKDVMSTHVMAVRETATFKEIAARLREHRVSAFPVVDSDGKVTGVVSEADLLTREGRVKRLPVTDDAGRLIGIVTRSDVLSVYSRPDGGIQREIKDLILCSFLCDPTRFTVNVKDGVVTIGGTPQTASVGHDIIDAIRHIEGVVAVRDRLRYPPSPEYLPSALF